jgi:hypothetical protein
MSNQLQATGAVKVRNLTGVLVGTSGVVSSLNIDGSLGIPQLDVNGKILVSQLPNSVMEYKGTWDASTNTPTLVNGTGNQGDVYLCSVAGTVNFGAGAIAFFVGDQVIYSGSIWQRASGASGTVTSVAVTETGDSLNITGSPITTSGTINIGFNGTNLQYINGAGNLTTFPALTGYVPYTGATQDVDLGAFNLTADVITGATGSFTSNGGSNTFAINHSSGAGIALNITKGGNNEGLYINKTSGSGNAATIVGKLEATTLVKTGGTSSQFLKADGSVDSSGYVPYTGATTDLNLGVHLLRFTTEASDNASIGTTVSGASSYFDFNLSDDNNQEEWRFRFTPSGGSVYDAVRIRPVSATKSDLLVSGDIGASNFSGSSGGTNTGDVTLGTANGLSLAGQVLSLAAASASTTGALTSTDWSSFNSKVSSQWTTSGSDIYYNTGNVSVNTTTSGVGRFFVAADTDSGITIRNTGTSDRFQLFVGSTGGATYTPDNAIIKGTNTDIDFYNGSTATKKVTIPNSGNYLEVYGDAYVQSYVKIGNGSGNYTALTTIASGTKIVTFPNATGTVALTSDIPSLTGYVPYTGATTNLDLGANGLYANNLTITKISTSATIDFPNTGTMNDPAFIRHTESPDNTAVMSFSVGDNDATNDYFVFGNTSSGFVERFKITATGVVTIGTWNASAIADAYISSAATWNGKVSSVSATSPVVSSGGTTPTISMAAATTSVSGYLTSTDWTTFNNKGTFTLPSLTSGSVLFSNGSTIAQDNANFFWDDTNNRLGIGNATPSYPLDVTGIIKGSTSIYATNDLFIGDTTGSATGRLIITDSSNQGINIRRTNAVSERFKMFVGNGTTYTQDNGIILGVNTDIDFYTGATPTKAMTVFNSGDLGVGIATANPIGNGGTYRNILVGNGAGYGVFQGVSTATATNSLLVAFSGGTSGASSSKNAGSINLSLDGTSTTNAVGRWQFYTNDGTNFAERLRITSTGRIYNSNAPANSFAYEINASTTTSQSYGLTIYGGTNSSDAALVINNGTGSVSNLFKVRGDGYVGIGTGSPQCKLQVSGSANFSAVLKVSDTGTESTGVIVLGDGGSTTQNVGIWRAQPNSMTTYGNSLNLGSYADMVFTTGAASLGSQTERMRIKAGGYIDLNNVVYNDTASSPRTLYIASAGTIGGISSIRASKKNIENVSNIDWLYQLNPVTFNYRKKDENRNYTEEIYDEITYGLIAEDTEPIAEFLINYDDSSSDKKMIGIEYMKLITPMLKAIQELKAEIDELKNK